MRAIVFDITGVIFPYQPWVGERPAKDKFAQIKQIGSIGYADGPLTRKLLRERIFKSELPYEELEAIYRSLTSIDENIVRLIERLSYTYDLYCIANEAEHWTDIRKELTNFHKYFKKLYISVEVGVRKPDKEIYHLLLDETQLHADECLFIDDKEKNVNTAVALGFKGYVYSGFVGLEDYLIKNDYQLK